MPALFKRIVVSENKRYLVHEADQTPFFYLADTAWELFHRLDREDTLRYLADRCAKRFTVIQAVALAELNGLNEPNAYGHVPFQNHNPALPNQDYWQHVDWVVQTAAAYGLRIGMLPTWGDKWNNAWGFGPVLFDHPDVARAYGRWLGQRYRDAGVIWILGGDRHIENQLQREVVIAMGAGLREGDGGANLITYHPKADSSSSMYFADEPWLDFHMWQSGHRRNTENYALITRDWNRTTSTKPVLDGEPGYEDHPASFKLDNGYLEAYDCRKAFYWATFAGACGHTYGCHPIWQFWVRRRKTISLCRREWIEALNLPGASHMQHGRALLESRPYVNRIPDQSLVVSKNNHDSMHVRATRDSEGSYAMFYVPCYAKITVNLALLTGTLINAWWYDPRTGAARLINTVERSVGHHEFHPPTAEGPDWVLVLDDASRNFSRPGRGF